jgi:hypothetical protein
MRASILALFLSLQANKKGLPCLGGLICSTAQWLHGPTSSFSQAQMAPLQEELAKKKHQCRLPVVHCPLTIQFSMMTLYHSSRACQASISALGYLTSCFRALGHHTPTGIRAEPAMRWCELGARDLIQICLSCAGTASPGSRYLTIERFRGIIMKDILFLSGTYSWGRGEAAGFPFRRVLFMF